MFNSLSTCHIHSFSVPDIVGSAILLGLSAELLLLLPPISLTVSLLVSLALQCLLHLKTADSSLL